MADSSHDGNSSNDKSNVIDIFTRQTFTYEPNHFIRLSPELDGLEMLYSNDAHPGKVFTLKILCWGLRATGEVVALIPWMNNIVACPDLQDPLGGRWDGYYDSGLDEAFFDAPMHKVLELEAAAEYYEYLCATNSDAIQEIPDAIGTHAVMEDPQHNGLVLTEVVSWQLRCDGSIHGMLIDPNQNYHTPVLPGDTCLFSAQESPRFRYFFQHHIANKIKARDPEALAAMASLLVDPGATIS